MDIKSIETLEEANQFVKQTYGPEAALNEVIYKNKPRYKFANVYVIRNYPYLFKSVKTAMSGLRCHELNKKKPR